MMSQIISLRLSLSSLYREATMAGQRGGGKNLVGKTHKPVQKGPGGGNARVTKTSGSNVRGGGQDKSTKSAQTLSRSGNTRRGRS